MNYGYDWRFFGLMINESIGVTMTCHIVVFATFVEGKIPITIFWDHLRLSVVNKMHKLSMNFCLNQLKSRI